MLRAARYEFAAALALLTAISYVCRDGGPSWRLLGLVSQGLSVYLMARLVRGRLL